MVKIYGTRRCSHFSCTRRPVWGVLTDCAATVCYLHKSDVSGVPVFNFRAKCKAEGCRKLSRWGINGEQPTHCLHHGPLEDGLVCTVATARGKMRDYTQSY
ncbi:unnamed protein product, partial [Laminaria digitata]